MSWNYRAFEEDDFITVHEVYYNKDGTIHGWTEQAIRVGGDSVQDIQNMLKVISHDLSKLPVIKVSELSSLMGTEETQE